MLVMIMMLLLLMAMMGMMMLVLMMMIMLIMMMMMMIPKCGRITRVVDTGGHGWINCTPNLKHSHHHHHHHHHHRQGHHDCHNHHQCYHSHYLCELNILTGVNRAAQRINRMSVVLNCIQQPKANALF